MEGEREGEREGGEKGGRERGREGGREGGLGVKCDFAQGRLCCMESTTMDLHGG